MSTTTTTTTQLLPSLTLQNKKSSKPKRQRVYGKSQESKVLLDEEEGKGDDDIDNDDDDDSAATVAQEYQEDVDVFSMNMDFHDTFAATGDANGTNQNSDMDNDDDDDEQQQEGEGTGTGDHQQDDDKSETEESMVQDYTQQQQVEEEEEGGESCKSQLGSGTGQESKPSANVESDADSNSDSESQDPEDETMDEMVQDFTQQPEEEEEEDSDVASGTGQEDGSLTAADEKIAITAVTDEDILDAVDIIYSEMEELPEDITVKDIVSAVQMKFDVKLEKERRELIKERLIELVSDPAARPEEVVTDQEILDAVDIIYSETEELPEDIDVKGIISLVGEKFGIKLEKGRRELIKERLIELVSDPAAGPEDDEEEQVTDQEILDAVNSVYDEYKAKGDDDDNIAVKDLVPLVEKKLGVALQKKKRKLIRHRLDLLQSETNPESKAREQVTDQDILETVDTLFSEADTENVTVKDIVLSLQEMFGVTLEKEKRIMIKERLIELINAENEGEDEGSRSDSDDDASTYSDGGSGDETKRRSKSKKSRPQRTPKQRKPSALKIHHEMLRKRQVAEMAIREEELRNETTRKISQADQKCAQLIAKKFETDNIELRTKRVEDRIGLLQKLEQKRLRLLNNDDGRVGTTACEKEEHGDETMEKVKEPTFVVKKEKMDQSILKIDHRNDCKSEDENDDGSCSDSDDESGSDSDSEDELEIIGMTKASPSAAPPSLVRPSLSRKASPKSVIDYFSANATASEHGTHTRNRNGDFTSKNVHTRPTRVYANPRATLRNALKAKQYENGNKWLAKELGYNTLEDHIRDCTLVEQNRRKQILEKEQQRLRDSEKRNEHWKALVKGEVIVGEREDTKEEVDAKGVEEDATRTRVDLHAESEPDEEEDEEMVLARELEEEKPKVEEKIQQDDAVIESLDHEETMVQDFTQAMNNEDEDKELKPEQSCSAETNEESLEDTLMKDHTQDHSADTEEGKELGESAVVTAAASLDNKSPSRDTETGTIDQKEAPNTGDANPDDDEQEFEEASSSANLTSDTELKEKRPRNAAWKAILQKEKELLKKRKARRGEADFVEAEAEEEEEEEGVAGLEDFGFTLASDAKKKGDGEDDENVDADDDDFEDIVDDVSDNEGDEEAGEAARNAMNLNEEKMRHKEIMRRMREGYDGKRGGVAGGSGARGNIRFDQLVAADNRDDAKRLGLLNDDEVDSDDEGNGKNEIEDEQNLLDKMLKDRHLERTNIPEENFTDSEDEDNDNDDEQKYAEQNEDNDERYQDLMAKRFARRARMNRLLEEYGEDKEFSQTPLLTQDESLRKELNSIRVSVQISIVF